MISEPTNKIAVVTVNFQENLENTLDGRRNEDFADLGQFVKTSHVLDAVFGRNNV